MISVIEPNKLFSRYLCVSVPFKIILVGIQFMYSEKRKILIIKNELNFCFHKKLNNDIERWKCIQKSIGI